MEALTFMEPAHAWSEALPIGNGRIGAMIYGNTGNEQIPLNADSIWYGGPQDRVNPQALHYLPKIRSLLLEEQNIEEAQKQMEYAFSATPQSQRPYQTAGNLWIKWEKQVVDSYQRQLNLEEGLVSVVGKTKNGALSKEYIASYPAKVLAMHFAATGTQKLSFSAMLERGRYYDGAGQLCGSGIGLWGNTGCDGIQFFIGLVAEQKGGSCEVVGEHLLVNNADEVFLYLTIETSFYEKRNIREVAKEKLEHALKRGYWSLRAEHISDYQALYKKVDFKLYDGSNQEIASVRDFFQFGRYLAISSSRPGSLPANLQGIWNDQFLPPWDSKYTININLEMNYWAMEGCGLSECHLPLFDLLKRMQIRGREVAKSMYGCRGFVAHHNTDIWADCAPQDIYIPATYWVMGGAWLSTHIWKHYVYTKDRCFLEEMYPVLQEAVLFFHDYLIEYQGKWVTCPSVSPENTYILPNGASGCVCAGAAMDFEILRDLFLAFQKASKVLQIEDETVQRTKELMKALPELQIGEKGQIVEWLEDYEEAEPGHRHISHLYALHPSYQITPDGTPELSKAAAKTLERRLLFGGGHTGWSCAWIVNMYARLWDGEQALVNLKKLMEQSTFPNYMTTHPMGDSFVFQIDGNFGLVSAILEMLLQSNEERVVILPALPKEWKKGSIKGLVIPTGAVVDITWDNAAVTECRVQAKEALHTWLVMDHKKIEVDLAAGQTYCYTKGF